MTMDVSSNPLIASLSLDLYAMKLGATFRLPLALSRPSANVVFSIDPDGIEVFDFGMKLTFGRVVVVFSKDTSFNLEIAQWAWSWEQRRT